MNGSRSAICDLRSGIWYSVTGFQPVTEHTLVACIPYTSPVIMTR